MLKYNIDSHDDFTLLKLTGDFNINASECFKTLKKEILSHETDLLIDCSQLNYIDSIGLGMLLDLKNKFNNFEKNIILYEVNLNIQNVFEVIGITDVFTVVDNYEEAYSILQTA